MKALITGASSGIGKEMAFYLASQGIDLILVARRKGLLEDIKEKVSVNVQIIAMDLSVERHLYKLHDKIKEENIDILINNAGFGLFGLFHKTDLEREIEMIDLNVKAYHILTKLFLQDFIKKDKGYILNVASSAGFLAGPRLSTYYATKNYVLKLTMAINEELRQNKNNVVISALCPGPVATEFNRVAEGKFKTKGVSSKMVAKYAIDKMFKKKLIIIPEFNIKLGVFFSRFLPYRWMLKKMYNFQKRKTDKR